MSLSSYSEASATRPNLPAADALQQYPRRLSSVGMLWGRWSLATIGWRIEGSIPEIPQSVIVVAPHTSNWDAVLCLFAMFALDMRVSWYGKHSMFWFPAGSIFRWLGGVPVDRSAGAGAVDLAISRYRSGEPWMLGIAPEGTRKRVEEWKTGFQRIAVGAGIPIVPVAVDYGTRTVRIFAPISAVGGQDVRDLQDVQDVRDLQDLQDLQDVRDVRDVRDLQDVRDLGDEQDLREVQLYQIQRLYSASMARHPSQFKSVS